MLMANRVDELAKVTPGKDSMAIEAFSRALRQIPTILADNGGFDGCDLVSRRRAAHYRGQSTAGLDVYKGAIAERNGLKGVDAYKGTNPVPI